MRKLVVALVLIALVVAASIVYLMMTTPKTAPPLVFPLTSEQQRFVARVPASAESFAYIPAAAVVHRKMLENPVAREPLLAWEARQPLPRAWVIGGADVLLWRSGKSTSFAVKLDPVRAKLIRVWTWIAGPHDTAWDGDVMLVGDVAPPPPSLDLALADGLPAGDALLVQRRESRGAFPPMGRPAFTAVKITRDEIILVSRAEDESAMTAQPRKASFPKGAILSVAFSEPPKLLGDLGRLLGTDIVDLVRDGGSLSLYEIDAGLLLPRPKGVIAVPANDAGRAALDEYRKYVELVGEIREANGQFLVSFDRTSVGAYVNDARVPAAWPANRWSGRIDPEVLIPILRRLGDSHGLRFAAPRIHRASRDLRNWIGALEKAEAIEAAASASGGVEELRVRIVSK